MKKTIYLFSGLFAVLFTTSCKKDYTCECTNTETETYTYNGVTQTYTDISVTKLTIKDASKHAAKSNCLDLERTYTYNYGNLSGSYTSKYECDLK